MFRLHGNKSDINKLPPGGLWDGATPGSAESAKRTVCEQVRPTLHLLTHDLPHRGMCIEAGRNILNSVLEHVWPPRSAYGREIVASRAFVCMCIVRVCACMCVRVCQVGLRGELSCRLYWGNVQEPSALDALTQLFPHAYVEEVRAAVSVCVCARARKADAHLLGFVSLQCIRRGCACVYVLNGCMGVLCDCGILLQVGLLTVDPATLPAVWGCTIDGFPALGASPDALICHWLPITSQAIMQVRCLALSMPGQHLHAG